MVSIYDWINDWRYVVEEPDFIFTKNDDDLQVTYAKRLMDNHWMAVDCEAWDYDKPFEVTSICYLTDDEIKSLFSSLEVTHSIEYSLQ